MLDSGLAAVSSVGALSGLMASNGGSTSQPSGFLDLVNSALQGVSASQNTAATSESGFAVGAPGATLGAALVASDKAEIGWNATVAVRNELVSAYQSVMNMQF